MMLLRAARAVALTAAFAAPLAAQLPPAAIRNPRATDYLFASDVQDARALWVNPAGLGSLLQASVMGELVVDRLVVPGGALRIAQYSLAFNSRGFSVGYTHDGFEGIDASNSTIRVGLARGVGGFAAGATLGFYNADVSQRGLDIGVRYALSTPLALTAVLRDIGEPVLRDSVIHPRGVLSATAYLLQNQVTLSGEAVAVQRPALLSGYDVTYRAGASLQSGGRLPVGGLVALDLANNFKIDRWSVGLSIGGLDRMIGTATFNPNATSASLERFAVTGVATSRPPR